MAHTLGKDQRLKSRKLIKELFESGKRFSAYPLRVTYQFTEKPIHLQTGFSVSIRNFKAAVVRNRLKRLMRESYRLQKTTLEETLKENGRHLLVFIIYTGRELETYEKIAKRMKSALTYLTVEAQKKEGNV